jgi:hypothetical protein
VYFKTVEWQHLQLFQNCPLSCGLHTFPAYQAVWSGSKQVCCVHNSSKSTDKETLPPPLPCQIASLAKNSLFCPKTEGLQNHYSPAGQQRVLYDNYPSSLLEGFSASQLNICCAKIVSFPLFKNIFKANISVLAILSFGKPPRKYY